MKDLHKTGPSGTDDRLKELSDGYELPFDDTAWEKMENLLDPEKPNRSPLFFTLKIVITMIFFLTLIYFSFTTLNTPPPATAVDTPIIEAPIPIEETTTDPFSPEEEILNAEFRIPNLKFSPLPPLPISKSAINAFAATPVPLLYTSVQVPFLPLVTADTSFFRMLQNLTTEHQKHFQPEKVYVHLDRPFFKQGEDIWFTVYLRDAADFKPSRQSNIVYVELIAPNGKVEKKITVLAAGGSGAGDFSTSAAMAGGTYKIKAYTSWQENTGEFFERDIQIQKTVLPRLRMEFDFAREAYGPGDKVRAYLNLKTLDNKVLANHDFTYQFNLEGNSIAQATGKTNEKGQAQLAVDLPEVLNSTDGLINVLIAYDGQTESISRSIPIVRNKIDLQFFPEGGNAIAGMTGKIAFKTINEFGEPADVEGVVLDKNSKVVASFKSYHMGMGAFEWKPQAGEKYTAKLTRPRGIADNYTLPEAIGRGYSLEVVEQNDEEILVEVKSTEKEPLYLIAQSRDKIYKTLVTPNASGVHTLHIPTADMPLGIAQLTLFDSREIPRAERLVFLNPHKKLSIKVTTDKEKYQPREKVKIKVEVNDDRGLPVPGTFSLAVVDDNLLTYADDKQGHLLAHFLLESELKGKIKEPNFYFDPPKTDDGKDRALALDHLLMTQGWRRFDWVEVLGQKMATMDLPAEKILLSGIVVDEYGMAVEEGTEVTIAGTSWHTLTGEEGLFTFESIGFPESTKAIEAAKGTVKGISIRKSTEEYIFPASKLGTMKVRKVKGADKIIKGRLFDARSGEPLIGGNVVEKGTNNGTVADFDGNFQLEVSSQSPILEFNYIGFEPKEQGFTLQEGYQLMVEAGLMEGDMILQEVTVTAYKVPLINQSNTSTGTVQRQKIKRKKQRKEAEKSRKGQMVKAKDIAQLPTKNINALAATTAGLQKRVGGKNVVLKGNQVDAPIDMDDQIAEEEPLIFEDRQEEKEEKAEQIAYPKYLHRTRTFYSPKYKVKEKTAQRSDFRSTIYWNPALTIDRNGKGEIEFYNSDDITTFKTIIEGFGINGSIGRSVQRHYTQLPFGLDIKVPTHVLTGDILRLPLVLSNNTDKTVSGNLKVTNLPEGFILEKSFSKKQSLKSGERKTVFLHYKVGFKAQSGALDIAFESNGFSDSFSQKMEVTSRGFPIRDMYSGKVKETTFAVEIGDAIEGSMEVAFRAYPSLVGDISSGLDRMLRQPRGCFEQTSSSNYPNLLVLDYLEAMNIKNPKAEKIARDYLDAGYKRLLTFEVEGGGFDWYGKAPAHEALTAYGLMQFVDMKKVYSVEQDLIDRTAKWLLSQRDGKGGWKKSKRGLHTWEGESAIANTYIAWAMTEAGFGSKIKKEIEQSYRDAIKSEDPYLMALTLGILENTKDQRAGILRKQLIALQQKDGSWNGLTHSMTHSKGKSLMIETSALSILSILKNGQNANPLNSGIEFIAASKSVNGFGSTQSTVLAMKALLDFAKDHPSKESNGKLTLYIDGQKIAEQAFDKNQKDKIVFPDLASHFTPGKHEVRIRFDDKDAVLPYDLAINYFTKLPRNPEETPVKLQTSLQETQPSMGTTVRLNITLSNVSKEAVPNTIAMVGIPSGLSLQPWQLKELQQKEACDYIELFDGYVVFHFLGLDRGAEKIIALDLKADIPGSYEAPASSAYLYYMDEYKYWTKPEIVKVSN